MNRFNRTFLLLLSLAFVAGCTPEEDDLLPPPPDGPGPDDTSPWAYRRTITLAGEKISGDLANFPVLVDLTGVALTGVRADAFDIRFVAADGVTQLAHERLDLALAYVKLPSLVAGQNTSFYVYYGNPDATDQAQPSQVWDSNYQLVMHGQNASDPAFVLQSTSHTRTLEKLAASEDSEEVAGRQGRAQQFDGDDALRLNSLDVTGWSAYTFEAWVYRSAKGGGTRETLLSNWNSLVGPAAVLTRIQKDTGVLQSYAVAESGQVGGPFSDLVVPVGSWKFVAVMFDGSTAMTARVDGTKSATSHPSNSNLRTDENMAQTLIGKSPHSGLDMLNGMIQELRLSNVRRSDAWLNTQYLNQLDPAAFHTVGEEEAVP